MNAIAVLGQLVRLAPCPLHVLKDKLPLKHTSIFNTLTRLAEAELTYAERSSPKGQGRPEDIWRLREDAGFFIAVHYGNSANYYSLCDFSGNCVLRREEPCCKSLEEAIAQTTHLCRRLMEHGLLKGKRLIALAVCLSGVVNSATGKLLTSWRWKVQDFSIAEALTEALADYDLFVIAENDARAAAWGEKCEGKNHACRHMLTLCVHGSHPSFLPECAMGTAVGIVFNGEIYHGHHGMAGEFDFLFDRSRQNTQIIHTLEDLTPAQLRESANIVGEDFAQVASLLAPEKLVVNFIEHPINPGFVHYLQESFERNILPKPHGAIPIEVSQLREQAILLGGAALLKEYFFRPSLRLLKTVRSAFEAKGIPTSQRNTDPDFLKKAKSS